MAHIRDATFRHDNCILNSRRKPRDIRRHSGNTRTESMANDFRFFFFLRFIIYSYSIRNLETKRPTRVGPVKFIEDVGNSSFSFTSPVNLCIFSKSYYPVFFFFFLFNSFFIRPKQQSCAYPVGTVIFHRTWRKGRINLAMYTGSPKLFDTIDHFENF